MSGPGVKEKSRPTTGVTGTSRPSSVPHKAKTNKDNVDLKSKEEEYRRLNEELESKAASLLKEADTILEHVSHVSDNENDTNVSISDLQLEPKLDTRTSVKSKRPQSVPQKVNRSLSDGSRLTATRPATGMKQQSKKRPPVHRQSQSRTGYSSNTVSLQSDINSDVVRRTKSPGMDQSDIAIAASSGMTTELFENVINTEEDYSEDILPEAAAEMGQEATIRFLKAKLRVMQEEMDRLCNELAAKNKKLATSDCKNKELTDEVSRLKKSQQGNQIQMEKYKSIADDLKSKSEGLEAQVLTLKKELDSMKRAHTKTSAEHGAVEVRLNRALEEAEKYKDALQEAKSDMADLKQQDKVKLEDLNNKNKKLEKQKNELMAAFKKQMKLIDILKRQKMHLEAAKLLSFTEEEFLKALDWAPS